MTATEILTRLPLVLPTSHSCLVRLPACRDGPDVLVIPYDDGRAPPFYLIFFRPETWTEEAVARLLSLVAEQLASRAAFLARHLVN